MFDEQPDGDPHGECAAEIHRLQALVIECRSSVKFDLLHYEKMARAYGNIGREGEQTAAMAEVEAQRLHDLLAKIDAVPPAPTFADGMTAEDDRRFLELTNDLTHNSN